MSATATAEQVPQMIADAAARYGVPTQLAVEVGATESSFNQNAVSSAGAIGVMQLMSATAAGLGVNPYDLAENIDGGVRYLSQLLSRYAGDAAKALAAYNWGMGNVDSSIASYGANWLARIPGSVQRYVSGILNAAGSAYQAAVTPAAVASAAGAAVEQTAQTFGAVPIALLAAVAVGGFVVADLLFGDE